MSRVKGKERKYGTNISGSRIKEARSRRQIGQSELVAALEVEHRIKLHRSALGLIEQQKRSVSDIELVAISKVLEVSVQWLLFGEEKDV
ncbi:MAG: helix-turn-helix domain-containing protein [Desulfobacterales bacterium]|nr:helix-turn-helix domain-containing protein [Desulfobacterales bacterium]